MQHLWATCVCAQFSPCKQNIYNIKIFKIKNLFIFFRQNLLCFILCSLPLALSVVTTEESQALSFFHLPFKYLYTWIYVRSPLSPSSKPESPSSLNPYSNFRCSISYITLMVLLWTLQYM